MDPLTEKQREILRVIRTHIEARGFAPTIREIGAAVKLRSSCSVKKHLDSLEAKGVIRRDRYQREIELLEGGEPVATGRTVCVPLLGRVAGGAPLLVAPESDPDMIPVPLSLLPRGAESSHDLFALEVRGDSMRDAGIADGDLVIARKQSTARDGEIVIAQLDDEATVKTFYREKDRFRLQPENPDYEPIYTTEVSIIGKVALAIKRF
jgi:repressor LexA